METIFKFGEWERPFNVALVTGLLAASLIHAPTASAADVVPPTVKMPGTQPGEVGSLQTANRCDNCHGGYDPAAEPAHLWNGSMMAHAAADPLFWATVAIAEQDFDGSGDLCLRCHTPQGWLSGRSTPTDGSSLSPSSDSDGVECDLCHQLTAPLAQAPEPVGIQSPGFEASSNGEAHYGSGQYVMYSGNEKLGPYDDAEANHSWIQSSFHRSSDFCGTCHDVSNPVVGNVAPGHGTLPGADPVVADGALDGALSTKAAFNNPPYRYGVVERTYSEHFASALSTTLVAEADPGRSTDLPDELKQGSIFDAWNAAFTASGGATTDYADGTPRVFSCQSCHMPPIEGVGCDKVDPSLPRADMPRHEMSGGGYWMLEVMPWMEAAGTLPFGGGFAVKEAAMDAGKVRARATLDAAAALSVVDGEVKVLNLTGHKLISGYPEGRRMWLRMTWRDSGGQEIRVDGEYGDLTVQMDVNDDDVVDENDVVRTLLDLEGTNTRIYEAQPGISQEWAAILTDAANGTPLVDPDLAVAYDRVTGAATATLSEVAGQTPGTAKKTFHFVLNDTILSDNRIPPWRMSREIARQRNALPVPPELYGNPEADGFYEHFDRVALNPPVGAVEVEIDLLYQSTSWEYIQFLYLANEGGNEMLGDTGEHLLRAWYQAGDETTRMAEPHVMATITHTVPEPGVGAMVVAGILGLIASSRSSRSPGPGFGERI
ncbi:MAG: hypothetical protein JRF61_15455 [Deltaproteobacteria bacterium]|nr:hypothetical protein [Deltaproteobacteria bacterium]